VSSRTPRETAIICAACVAGLALLLIPFEINVDGRSTVNAGAVAWVAGAGLAGLAMVLLFRYLMTKKKTQIEFLGNDQYRALAEEYRRLSDLAITAQEHTDLKLGDVSAQLDYLREQTESLQRILKEVE
jgi:hypothetical protein